MQGPEREMGGWDPESTASYWINRASRLLMRMQDGRMREFGLGMSQLPVLVALAEGGSLSQKELAHRAKVEQPTMAEMLVRMERDGVVERQPNPKDARGSLTSLTRKARARFPKAKEMLMDTDREVTAGLRAEERKQLVMLLQKVVANLEGEGVTR